MAKKFGKFMLFSAIAGAAAAGAYYYMQRKQNGQYKSYDDIDEFDIFDEDLDEEFSKAATQKNRSYVSIDLTNAKEKIGEKVIEAIDKTKEKVEQFNVSEKLDMAKEKVEQFNVSEKLDKAKEFVEGITAVNHGTVEDDSEKVIESVAMSETYSTENVEPETSVVEEFYDDESEDVEG